MYGLSSFLQTNVMHYIIELRQDCLLLQSLILTTNCHLFLLLLLLYTLLSQHPLLYRLYPWINML
jgi:hypothetical protein